MLVINLVLFTFKNHFGKLLMRYFNAQSAENKDGEMRSIYSRLYLDICALTRFWDVRWSKKLCDQRRFVTRWSEVGKSGFLANFRNRLFYTNSLSFPLLGPNSSLKRYLKITSNLIWVRLLWVLFLLSCSRISWPLTIVAWSLFLYFVLYFNSIAYRSEGYFQISIFSR